MKTEIAFKLTQQNHTYIRKGLRIKLVKTFPSIGQTFKKLKAVFIEALEESVRLTSIRRRHSFNLGVIWHTAPLRYEEST